MVFVPKDSGARMRGNITAIVLIVAGLILLVIGLVITWFSNLCLLFSIFLFVIGAALLIVKVTKAYDSR